MSDSTKPTFRCGHFRTSENTVRRHTGYGECLTCHNQRMRDARPVKRPRGPRADSRIFAGEPPTKDQPPRMRQRTIRLVDPRPVFQPLRDPNANQGRSYSLAPQRSA